MEIIQYTIQSLHEFLALARLLRLPDLTLFFLWDLPQLLVWDLPGRQNSWLSALFVVVVLINPCVALPGTPQPLANRIKGFSPVNHSNSNPSTEIHIISRKFPIATVILPISSPSFPKTVSLQLQHAMGTWDILAGKQCRLE